MEYIRWRGNLRDVVVIDYIKVSPTAVSPLLVKYSGAITQTEKEAEVTSQGTISCSEDPSLHTLINHPDRATTLTVSLLLCTHSAPRSTRGPSNPPDLRWNRSHQIQEIWVEFKHDSPLKHTPHLHWFLLALHKTHCFTTGALCGCSAPALCPGHSSVTGCRNEGMRGSKKGQGRAGWKPRSSGPRALPLVQVAGVMWPGAEAWGRGRGGQWSCLWPSLQLQPAGRSTADRWESPTGRGREGRSGDGDGTSNGGLGSGCGEMHSCLAWSRWGWRVNRKDGWQKEERSKAHRYVFTLWIFTWHHFCSPCVHTDVNHRLCVDFNWWDSNPPPLLPLWNTVHSSH